MMKNVWQFARYERRKNCKKKIQGLKILKIYKKPQSFMDKGKHLPPLTRENDRNITAWMATKCEGELWGNLWLQPNIKRKINWFKTVMCVCVGFPSIKMILPFLNPTNIIRIFFIFINWNPTYTLHTLFAVIHPHFSSFVFLTQCCHLIAICHQQRWFISCTFASKLLFYLLHFAFISLTFT